MQGPHLTADLRGRAAEPPSPARPGAARELGLGAPPRAGAALALR
jgi:hypothetical protein